MLNRRDVCICFAMVAFIAGCGNEETKKMSKASKVVSWAELEKLREPQLSMGLFMNAQRGDIPGAKKAAADPKIQEVLDAFAKAPIPSEFASPAREKAKEKVVEAYKEFLDACKGSTPPLKIKNMAASVQQTFADLVNPDLK